MGVLRYVALCNADLMVTQQNGDSLRLLSKGATYECEDRGALVSLKTSAGYVTFEKDAFPSSHLLVL